MQLVVTQELIDLLYRCSIFSTRSGLNRKPAKPLMRWKIGDTLSYTKSTVIEEFSTIAAGNALCSSQSFSTTASPFTVNTKIGRYSAIGPGGNVLGFRHPIESLCMNSAFYNFARENVHPYFEQYEAKHGVLQKKAVPTPQPGAKPIIIGHDVWIASNVIFSGGISIGTGSVIATNTVLTKDIPPYSFVAGVPGKVKKQRFPDKIIYKLLDSCWWDYELGDMFRYNLPFEDPIKFLEAFDNLKEKINKYNPRKFYPLEFAIKSKINASIPRNVLISEHETFLCTNIKENSIVSMPYEKIDNKDIKMINVYIEDNIIYMTIDKENYIKTINGQGKFVSCKDRCGLPIVIHENDTISIAVFSSEESRAFLSARPTGKCTITSNCNSFEQFFLSNNFINSIMDTN